MAQEVLNDPLRVVVSAVSPVVMVSATALLISGMNARYISVSNRIRSLLGEHRDAKTADARRGSIRAQLGIFRRRLHLVTWAARWLYGAVGCFITVPLVISLATWSPAIQIATVPLFLLGLVLDAVAILIALIEWREANTTIDIELAEVLNAVSSKER
jgi:hypothetical protein